MLRFASMSRILLKSTCVGLILVLGAYPAMPQASAQMRFRSSHSDGPLKFSRARLLGPAVSQEADRVFVQSTLEGDETKGNLRLKSKFLGALKFIYNGQTPQKVYGFWGFTFKPEFQEILSQHPDALKEAKKAYPYNVLGFVGALGLVAVSAKLLIDSINDSQEISNGRLVDDSSSTTDVVLLGAAATITIVSVSLSKKHLENGVRMFNEQQR